MRVTRRHFLSGLRPKPTPPLLPPWAGNRKAFTEDCTGCGNCVKACPEGILALNEQRLAVIDFSRSGCSLCGDCVNACTDAALSFANRPAFPWQARIADNCLPRHHIECRVCGEACDAGAIHFKLQPGTTPTPELNEQLCTGCGQCFAPCPSGAISINLPQEAL